MGEDMAYERNLSKEFLELLKPGGALSFLVDAAKRPWRRDMYLDFQLRRDDTVMLYAGLTRLLKVQRKANGTICFSADKYFMDQTQTLQGCALPWGEKLDVTEAAELAPQIEEYLRMVEVPDYAFRKEGYVQNWLSWRFGLGRKSADDWVAIDREVVIGYEDIKTREAVWGPIQDWAKSVARELGEKPQNEFGTKLGDKSIGQELDLFLWDPVAKHLWVTEVKDGSDARGVYLSPIQVAAYTAIWRRFVEQQPRDALEGIRCITEQKTVLGLIAYATGTTLPEALTPDMFQPMIVIQEPKFKSDCWDRLKEVMPHVRSREGELKLGPMTDNLQIWQFPKPEITPLATQWWK